MAKQQTPHAFKMKQLAQGKFSATEGKWKITFVFDGVEYKKTHQLSQQEVKHMKDLCTEFGDVAADQIIWRAAIKGVGMVSEALIAQAGKDFVQKHHAGATGPASGEVSVCAATYDTLAALEAYVDSVKPLPDKDAFDTELAKQIQDQQQMGGKL